jgi:hypothetical protein
MYDDPLDPRRGKIKDASVVNLQARLREAKTAVFNLEKRIEQRAKEVALSALEKYQVDISDLSAIDVSDAVPENLHGSLVCGDYRNPLEGHVFDINRPDIGCVFCKTKIKD